MDYGSLDDDDSVKWSEELKSVELNCVCIVYGFDIGGSAGECVVVGGRGGGGGSSSGEAPTVSVAIGESRGCRALHHNSPISRFNNLVHWKLFNAISHALVFCASSGV